MINVAGLDFANNNDQEDFISGGRNFALRSTVANKEEQKKKGKCCGK